jgi:hypothetical protein
MSEREFNKHNGLRIQDRDTRKFKVIPLQAKVTVEVGDSLVKGRLQSVKDGRIYLEETSFAFNEIESIGRKNAGTTLKGVGILVLGVALTGGGVAYAVTTQVLPGVLGALAGAATVSMSPSVFRYGNRYHMDGEWMVIGPNSDAY